MESLKTQIENLTRLAKLRRYVELESAIGTAYFTDTADFDAFILELFHLKAELFG